MRSALTQKIQKKKEELEAQRREFAAKVREEEQVMLSALSARQNELAAKRREHNRQVRQGHLRDVKITPRRKQPRLFDGTFDPPTQPEARKPPTFLGVSAASATEQLELSIQLNSRFSQLQDDLGFRSWYSRKTQTLVRAIGSDCWRGRAADRRRRGRGQILVRAHGRGVRRPRKAQR